jgi:signal peptide peptidase SppA
MEPTDFSKGQGWLIRPESFEVLYRKFNEFHPLYSDNTNTKETFEKQIQSFKSRMESKDYYDLVDGIAVIPISGPLTKRLTFFGFLMGGSTFGMISKAFTAAMEDDEVSGIVLNIDSPGGTVSGTEALSDLIYDAKGQKPIVAFANGMMASSAYWIGSSADAVIGESTADIGSIGVLMIHRDYSEMDKKRGIKITYLTAGKYKALGNDAEPLTDFAKQTFQGELNYIYSIFVNTVARNRDVESDVVLSNMADGKIFIGQQAVDAGLIDQVGNLDMARSEKMDKDKILEITTTEQLAAAYPDLVIQIHKDAEKKGIESIDLETVAREAKAKETDRIMGLVNIQFGEEEGEKFKAIVESGVTVDQFKAVQATAGKKSEDDLKKKILEELENAGAENPGANAGAKVGDKDYMTLCQEYKAQHGCGITEAMKAVAVSHPKAHEAYIEAVNPTRQ